jgi:hypothetical protein
MRFLHTGLTTACQLSDEKYSWQSMQRARQCSVMIWVVRVCAPNTIYTGASNSIHKLAGLCTCVRHLGPFLARQHNCSAHLLIKHDLPVPVSPKDITFILSMRLLGSLRPTAALAAFIVLVNQMAGHYYQAQSVQPGPRLLNDTIDTAFTSIMNSI